MLAMHHPTDDRRVLVTLMRVGHHLTAHRSIDADGASDGTVRGHPASAGRPVRRGWHQR
jgi:hypothetical protein